MTRTFSFLRANDLVWGRRLQLYAGRDAAGLDLLFWNGDGTNLPGRMAVEYLRRLCQQNTFVGDGVRAAGPQSLRVSDVDVPDLRIACETDHIAPAADSWRGVARWHRRKRPSSCRNRAISPASSTRPASGNTAITPRMRVLRMAGRHGAQAQHHAGQLVGALGRMAGSAFGLHGRVPAIRREGWPGARTNIPSRTAGEEIFCIAANFLAMLRCRRVYRGQFS